MKGEKILTENVNKNPINVLSFKHPETGQDYYTPECDVIFRNLISKTENTVMPQKFAEGILEKEVGEVIVNVNRNFEVDSINDKEMEADVKMISKKNGGIYIFEMQTSAPDGITKKFSAYASSAYKSIIKKGMLYQDMPSLTLVVIMTKNIPKFKNVKNYHSVWNGREEVFKDEVFEEDITIHVIELPKYIEHKKKTNEINIWLEFIINPMGKEVEEAMRTKEELRLAVDMLNLLNSDDQVREMAFKEILDDIDRNSEINDNRKRALAEGRAEGIAKGRAEGENKLSTLINSLIDAGRNDEIQMVTSDIEFRQKLHDEFGIK